MKFRNALEKDKKIITAGGIYGTVKEVKDVYVLVEVDNNVTIRVDKNMVMRDPPIWLSRANKRVFRIKYKKAGDFPAFFVKSDDGIVILAKGVSCDRLPLSSQ